MSNYHTESEATPIKPARVAIGNVTKYKLIFLALLGSLCQPHYASAAAIEEQQINEIKPGITTEADLVRMFGPPDTQIGDTRGNRSLHWTKLGAPPFQTYMPMIGPWLGELEAPWQVLWVDLRANGRVGHYLCKIHYP